MSGDREGAAKKRIPHPDARPISENQLRYQDIADFSPGIICETDLSLNITYMNRFGRRTFGLTADDLTSGVTAFHLIHDEHQERAKNSLKRLIKGDVIHISEYRLRKRDGSEFWALVNAAPMMREKEAVGFRFSATDITRMRKLKVHFNEAQQSEAIATLSGGIAHKFNNLLAVLEMNLELLEMNRSGDNETNRYIHHMQEASRSMVKLTSQMLAYAGGGKYQTTLTAMNDLVRNTLSFVMPELDPSVVLEMDLPEDDFFIEGDTTQLEMVISSIIYNALEALEEGGHIRVSSKVVDREGFPIKRKRAKKARRYVRLEIADDGQGMDEETKSHIFEPFFTTKFEGRGMGLSAAYGIVKNHHGWIDVASRPGKGTKVALFLPALDDQDITEGQLRLDFKK